MKKEPTSLPEGPANPRIFMSFTRKRLDKIDFTTAAKKNKQFNLRGKINGRKRRVTVRVVHHQPCTTGKLVTVHLVTRSALNRPEAGLWIPHKRDEVAGLLSPNH